MDNNNTFEILNAINVNGMTEKKKQTNGTTLAYISWASAYQIAKQHFPDLSYEVERNPETGLPYWYDPLTGYMVFTKVTINGVTHEMWLPVLDATNHAMKSGISKCQLCPSFCLFLFTVFHDINKTLLFFAVVNLL